ncbi:hypothetical protein PFISCL1PPCAC_4317, partial [Pristionchus fissidentatus]
RVEMTSKLVLSLLCLLSVTASAHFFKKPKYSLPATFQTRNFPGKCAANDQTKTKSCLDTYFSMFNIDSSVTLPDYMDYARISTTPVTLYGIDGLDIYCSYETTLESCLGPLMNSPCMNPEGFGAMYGIDQVESNNYATNFQVEAYSCHNIDVSKKYFDCMSDIGSTNFQGIIDCSNTMVDEIQHATDACVPLGNYVQCVEDLYVKACDEGVRSLICNTQEIALNFDSNGFCADKLPKCDA